MMSAVDLTALLTAVVSVITAVTALVRVIRHEKRGINGSPPSK